MLGCDFVFSGQRAAEQLCQIARLVKSLNGGEDQFDGPFGGVAFGYQRIGQTQSTDHQVRVRRLAAVDLALHVLPFHDHGVGGKELEFLGHVLAVNVGHAHFRELHVKLIAQKSRQRNFQLRVGKEEDLFALQQMAVFGVLQIPVWQLWEAQVL